MAVDRESVPPVRTESAGHIFGESHFCRAVNRDVVVVVQIDKTSQTEMPSHRGRLRADSFHQITIRDKSESPMTHKVVTQTTPKMRFGYRHSHAGGESLAEWSCSHFDSKPMIDFWMTSRVTAPLAEIADVVKGDAKSTQMEH